MVFGGSCRLSQDKKTAISGKAATDKPALAGKPRAPTVQGKDRDMGFALRSVYQKTVEEPVPDDLLALLGKLG